MSAPDLTAIVEAVARDHHGDAYDSADEFSRSLAREAMLPFVTATLRALGPLADGWIVLATEDKRGGDRYMADLAHSEASRSYARGSARLTCATELRALIEGAK